MLKWVLHELNVLYHGTVEAGLASADGLSASHDAALDGALAALAGVDSEGDSGDIGGGGGGAGSDDDSDGGISPGHWSAGSDTDDDGSGIDDDDEGAGDPDGGADAGADAGAGFPFIFGTTISYKHTVDPPWAWDTERARTLQRYKQTTKRSIARSTIRMYTVSISPQPKAPRRSTRAWSTARARSKLQLDRVASGRWLRAASSYLVAAALLLQPSA